MNFPKTKKTGFSEKYIQTGFLNKYLVKKYKFKNFKTNVQLWSNWTKIKNNKSKASTAWGKDLAIGFLTKNKALGIGLNIDKKFLTG